MDRAADGQGNELDKFGNEMESRDESSNNDLNSEDELELKRLCRASCEYVVNSEDVELRKICQEYLSINDWSSVSKKSKKILMNEESIRAMLWARSRGYESIIMSLECNQTIFKKAFDKVLRKMRKEN